MLTFHRIHIITITNYLTGSVALDFDLSFLFLFSVVCVTCISTLSSRLLMLLLLLQSSTETWWLAFSFFPPFRIEPMVWLRFQSEKLSRNRFFTNQFLSFIFLVLCKFCHCNCFRWHSTKEHQNVRLFSVYNSPRYFMVDLFLLINLSNLRRLNEWTPC